MPSVVKYAVSRVLDKRDSVRRVAQDLNELHLVKVSVSTVQRWVNEEGRRDELPVDFSDEKPPENFSGFLSLDGTFKPVSLKKLSEIGEPKGGLLIATDSLNGKPIAGALVSGESEKEVMFLLEAMKSWLDRGIKLATIDFSPRLESRLKEVFPAAILQRCVFYAVQLLTRGFNKELLRVKKQELLDYIDEWKALRKLTFLLERDEECPGRLHSSSQKSGWQEKSTNNW
ncbi:MAG: hypothetical protein ACTSRH_16750 [Promethearchaeota archaeon]